MLLLLDAGLQTSAPSAYALMGGKVGGNKSGIYIFYAGRSPRAPSAYAIALSSFL